MTPQEKASEIILKYQDTRMDILTTQDSCPCIFSDFPTFKTAQKCALIAVSEILNELVPSDFKDKETFTGQKEYWQQVKHEIERL